MAAEPTATARRFIEQTTMKTMFGIPDEALDTVMAVAFQLYQAGRYTETEVLCRGLIAADHKYWWSYSLFAATLRQMGRFSEALAELDKGLAYEPEEQKLLYMRREMCAAIVDAAQDAAKPTNESTITAQAAA